MVCFVPRTTEKKIDRVAKIVPFPIQKNSNVNYQINPDSISVAFPRFPWFSLDFRGFRGFGEIHFRGFPWFSVISVVLPNLGFRDFPWFSVVFLFRKWEEPWTLYILNFATKICYCETLKKFGLPFAIFPHRTRVGFRF